jgi:5'-AMP-activated protein kinase, catalytic alpha subunit
VRQINFTIYPSFTIEHPLGPPIDVWAVGVVLFALLCGRLPFSGPNLSGDQPSSNQVRKNIVKCTYRIPDYVSGEAKVS